MSLQHHQRLISIMQQMRRILAAHFTPLSVTDYQRHLVIEAEHKLLMVQVVMCGTEFAVVNSFMGAFCLPPNVHGSSERGFGLMLCLQFLDHTRPPQDSNTVGGSDISASLVVAPMLLACDRPMGQLLQEAIQGGSERQTTAGMTHGSYRGGFATNQALNTEMQSHVDGFLTSACPDLV